MYVVVEECVTLQNMYTLSSSARRRFSLDNVVI